MSYPVSISVIALIAGLVVGCGQVSVPSDVATADPWHQAASLVASPATLESEAGAARQPHRKERVIVSIADRYLTRFSDVVVRLRSAGLEVEQSLKQIGVVTGTIRADKIAGLARLEGVAAVELERQVGGLQ